MNVSQVRVLEIFVFFYLLPIHLGKTALAKGGARILLMSVAFSSAPKVHEHNLLPTPNTSSTGVCDFEYSPTPPFCRIVAVLTRYLLFSYCHGHDPVVCLQYLIFCRTVESLKMGHEKNTIAKEGRPHHNPNTMQHRELLAPGPATRELRIRASPYQELACGRPKRKARSSTKESSSGSADEKDLQRTKQGNDQPIKALKVIHHRFSNGQPTNEHLRRVRNSYENDKSPRMGESSQSGEDVDSLQAGLDSSIYQGTFLGNWKCQAHEHDLRHTDEEKVNHPVLGRCMYQNERANTQTPNLPVADAAVNSSSESLSLHHHHPTTFAVSKSHPRSVNNRTVGDKTTDPYQLPQYPLMSIRDMALNLHPKVHAHNHTFNAEDDEAALASGKMTPCREKLKPYS